MTRTDRAPEAQRVGRAPTTPPLVVMVVANDVSTDTRVRKMAHDLAAGGLEVAVLGVSGTNRQQDFELGAARVTLLPVGNRMRIHPRLGRGFGRRHQISHEIAIRKANYFSYQRLIGARVGWLRTDYYRSRAERNERANERARRLIDRRRGREKSRLGLRGDSSHRENRPLRLAVRIAESLERKAREWRKRRRLWTESWFERWFKWSEALLRGQLIRQYRRHVRKVRNMERRLIKSIQQGDKPDWRRILPELHDYEIAFGPVLDSMRPDVIHAQDVHLLGVAARATARVKATGKDTKLIYDAHEYIAGLAHPRPAKAWTNLEAEHITRADAVITVAPAIADLHTDDYGLEVRPTVVMNIPANFSKPKKSLREEIDLSTTETLLVYSGGMDETRGVHTLVEALGRIPDVHLALVRKAESNYTIYLEKIASQGGFRDRLHLAPFVKPHEVVSYLSSADIGVHTIVSGPINHEVTLPNKVFEYMHARLPIVISDCRAMSELVLSLGVGEVFVSEDVDSLTEALERVVSNLDHYRQVFELNSQILETYSWRSERQKLFDLYRNLLGSDALPPDLQFGELSSVPLPSTGQ